MRIIKEEKKHRSYGIVSPIRQDIAYSYCCIGAETEIRKIIGDSKIDGEKNIDRRGPRQIGTVWHIPGLPTFSLPTTFKDAKKIYIFFFLTYPQAHYLQSKI